MGGGRMGRVRLIPPLYLGVPMADVITGLTDEDIDTTWRTAKASATDEDTGDTDADGTDSDADGADSDADATDSDADGTDSDADGTDS